MIVIFLNKKWIFYLISIFIFLVSCSKENDSIDQNENQKTTDIGDKVFTDDIIEKLFSQYDGSTNFANNEGEKSFSSGLPGWDNENYIPGSMSAVISGLSTWYSDEAWAFKSEDEEYIFLTGSKEDGGVMSIALEASYVVSGASLSVGNGVHSAMLGFTIYGGFYVSHDHAIVLIDFTDQNTIAGTFEFTAYNNDGSTILPVEITNGVFTNLQFREFE